LPNAKLELVRADQVLAQQGSHKVAVFFAECYKLARGEVVRFDALPSSSVGTSGLDADGSPLPSRWKDRCIDGQAMNVKAVVLMKSFSGGFFQLAPLLIT
jgi:hypothetical protein